MNMKNILVFIFIFLVSVGFVVGQSETCKDSDGGKDYFVKGTVTGLEAPDIWDTWIDYCGVAGEEEGKLVEYVCTSNNYGEKILYSCPNGCEDGACVSSSVNTAPEIIGIPTVPEPAEVGKSYSFSWEATDEDNDDLFWSIDLGDGTGMEVGACPESNPSNRDGWTFGADHAWSSAGTYTVKTTVSDCRGGSDTHSFSVKVSYTTTSCTDSDGGKNYYVKGTTTDKDGNSQTDYCAPEGLYERYCWEEYPGYMGTERVDCPNGCKDGACLKEPEIECTDSDGGKNYYEKGSCSDSVYGTKTDKCGGSINGVYNSEALGEHYCGEYFGDEVCLTTWKLDCPNGCQDGACLKDETLFYIADISGMKSAYTAGDEIKLIVKGVESDGSSASNEEGYNVQYYTYSTSNPDYYLQEYVPSGNYNGRYDDGYWYLEYWAPKKADKYYTEVVLYCSRENSKCWLPSNRGGKEYRKKLYFTVTDSAEECTDSDGGKNYYVKGTACEGAKCNTDYCQDEDHLFEIDCGYAGGIPFQDGCGHSGLGGCRYKCPNGCKDGVCIKSNLCGNGKCENTAKLLREGVTAILSYSGKDYEVKVTNIIINTYYDRKASLAVNGEFLNVAKEKSYTLADGESLYIKAIGTSANGIKQINLIIGEYEHNCPEDCMVAKSCEEIKINSEKYFDLCSQSGYYGVCFDKYEGRYLGCSDKTGKGCTINNLNAERNILCFAGQERKCTDSDGGKNYYVKGKTSGIAWGTSNYVEKTDFCITEGVKEGRLAEYFCEGSQVASISYECPNGCKYGACVKPENECSGKTGMSDCLDNRNCYWDQETDGCWKFDSSKQLCSDPDNGRNYEVQAHTWGFDEYAPDDRNARIRRGGKDGCTSSNRLIEHYCDKAYYIKTEYYSCPNSCKDGICIGGQPQGIYVKLGERFSLAERGEAKVTDYDYMKIILNKIVNVQCITTPCPQMVEVQVEMPSDCDKNEYGSNTGVCTSKGTKFTLKEGGSKEVFGAKLTFFSTDGKRAKFVVDKSISEGGVDIEINPVEQTISYGEKAVYKVTVTDKHTVPTCPEGAFCSPPNDLFYKIQIRNLPFSKDYPKEIWVPYGGSRSFELIVRPYEVVDEETDVESRTGPTMTITGKAVESTSETIIAKRVKISKIMVSEKETAVESVAVSAETVATSTGEIAVQPQVVEEEVAIPEESEEEPTVMVTSTHLMRKYKFSVTAKLKSSYKVQDTAHAVLAIKPETPPTPPPFPGEKVSIKLYKGWNLISLPGKLIKFDKSGLVKNQKLIGFVYLKEEQKYVSLSEAEKILGGKLREYLAKNAFWVYSRTPSTLNIWVDRKISYQDLELVKGWNLVPITEDMLGGYLVDVLGDCDLEKIHLWDAKNQKWRKISLEYSFSDYQFGYGFLVKAIDYCRLVGPEIIAPPAMPE